jgi:hypothetical protein
MQRKLIIDDDTSVTTEYRSQLSSSEIRELLARCPVIKKPATTTTYSISVSRTTTLTTPTDTTTSVTTASIFLAPNLGISVSTNSTNTRKSEFGPGRAKL